MTKSLRRSAVVCCINVAAIFTACSFNPPTGNSSTDPDASTSDANGSESDGTPTETDSDGDGIDNNADNCVNKVNPGQFDLDEDSIGNACDNCPHLANSNQSETGVGPGEPDGVGDLCDPDSGVAHTLLFDSFNGENPLNWTLGATWELDPVNSLLRKENEDVFSSSLLEVPQFAVGGLITASIRFLEEDGSGNGDDRRLAAVVGPVGPNDVNGCALFKNRNQNDDNLSAFEVISSSYNSNTTTFPFNLTTFYTVTMKNDGTNTRCAVENVSTSQNTTAAGNQIGVRSTRTRMHLDWFVAIVTATN